MYAFTFLLQLLRMRLQLQQQQQQHVAALVALYRHRQEIRQRRRQFWVHPWIQRRVMYGNYDNLMVELEREAQGDFTKFLRMEPEMFHELVQRLTPRLTKQETRFRQPLDTGMKLAIALRYMTTGNTYHSLSYSFRVPHNSISKFMKEVCEAIIAEYEPEVFNLPTTPDGWRQIADKFGARWNFHHACGARQEACRHAITC